MIEREIGKRRAYALLSLILPGLGQILSGRVIKGILQLLLLSLFVFVMKTVWNGINFGFVAFLLALIFYWMYIVWDAYAFRDNRSSPCERACPVGLDVSGYINLALIGDLRKAKSLVYHRTPLGSVLSYICHEPCKKWCARRKIDNPLEIRAIKRYIFHGAGKTVMDHKKRFSQKIAIVGAGPCGLSAAYFLSRIGYEAVLFDARSTPGGVLSEFIPEYRLPEDILNKDIDEILSSDLIEFKGNTILGNNIKLSQLKEDFDAVFIATGAWGKRSVGIKGEDKKGVMHALDFLRAVKAKKVRKIYGTVFIIGGGDVATDAARSAARLSVHRKVVIAYRRSKKEMKIDEVELSEMEEEGIEIIERVLPLEFKGKDIVESVVFGKTTVDNGRVRVTGEKLEVEASLVIIAIGQSVHRVADEIATDESGRILINKDYVTSVKGVFAGGDATKGPSSVVEALRDGREAARNIHRYLNPFHYKIEGFLYFNPYHIKPDSLIKMKSPAGEHVLPLRISYSERIGNFKTVELSYGDEEAKRECSRCLACNFRYR